MAVSRARDRAELVTDDARKLADQLERATGERVSALDAPAESAARRSTLGRQPVLEAERDHAPRVHDAVDLGHPAEAECRVLHDRERTSRMERDSSLGADG